MFTRKLSALLELMHKWKFSVNNIFASSNQLELGVDRCFLQEMLGAKFTFMLGISVTCKGKALCQEEQSTSILVMRGYPRMEKESMGFTRLLILT